MASPLRDERRSASRTTGKTRPFRSDAGKAPARSVTCTGRRGSCRAWPMCDTGTRTGGLAAGSVATPAVRVDDELQLAHQNTSSRAGLIE
jgi:hypothetical protein